MFRLARRLAFFSLACSLLPLAWPIPATAADAAPRVLVILDASGSMWGQIAGENKIVIARRVMKELLTGLPDGSEVGLVAYGHRRESDCEDVETMRPVGPLDRSTLGQTVDALNPKGKTPLNIATRHAIDLVRKDAKPTTVVLLSDGLETCAGNLCQTVREAKAAGVDLVLHVIGFDVGEADVAPLECAAQAGGGLYFPARDAKELLAALDQAVAVPTELPTGILAVTARADGALADAVVRVVPKGGGKEVAFGRTYRGAETNPRRLALPDGTYDVTVEAVGMDGQAAVRFPGVVIASGKTVEKVADWTSGEVAVKVTRNGELSDATVQVLDPASGKAIASGRTYRAANSNPKVYRVPAGTYDVEIASVEIEGKPSHRFTGVEVQAGSRSELAHAFTTGTLRIAAVRGSELVDAVVSVYPAGKNASVANGRTYTRAESNPKAFELAPGNYRVVAKSVKPAGLPDQELTVTVNAGATSEHRVDFGQ